MRDLREQEENGRTVLYFSGKVDIEFVQAHRPACLVALVRQPTMTLDMSETTHMDSSGLGFLVALRKTASGNGGAITLRAIPPYVDKLLTTTGLKSAFQVV